MGAGNGDPSRSEEKMKKMHRNGGQLSEVEKLRNQRKHKEGRSGKMRK